jgi:hypothetical protein
MLAVPEINEGIRCHQHGARKGGRRRPVLTGAAISRELSRILQRETGQSRREPVHLQNRLTISPPDHGCGRKLSGRPAIETGDASRTESAVTLRISTTLVDGVQIVPGAQQVRVGRIQLKFCDSAIRVFRGRDSSAVFAFVHSPDGMCTQAMRGAIGFNVLANRRSAAISGVVMGRQKKGPGVSPAH